MSILNVEHLTHGFGDRAIFNDVSFRLLKGEHIGLVGANGEGKSTFFNIVTGKLMPDEGKIEWAKNRSIPEGKETEEGNSYEQYLQMMLVLKSKEELSMRALDLVEMNLRSRMEKTFFRADACVSGADFDMTCYLRRGIRYQYHILYQYQ